MPPAFLCFYTLFLTDRKISVIYKNTILIYLYNEVLYRFRYRLLTRITHTREM